MNKTQNNRAWWLVVPVLVLVAFNAFIPLMTVVNYAFQETFGDNVFFWEGTTWFEQVLRSPRFHASLIRQLPAGPDATTSPAATARPHTSPLA